MKDYTTFVLGRNHFIPPEHLEDYKVRAKKNDRGALSYTISAKFSFDTPIGEIIPFLEGGGIINYTKDGVKKRIILEQIEDGS